MLDFDTVKASACTGKHPHDSRASADRQIRSKDKGLASYRCAFCGKWHVGKHYPANVREHFRRNMKKLKRRAT